MQAFLSVDKAKLLDEKINHDVQVPPTILSTHYLLRTLNQQHPVSNRRISR